MRVFSLLVLAQFMFATSSPTEAMKAFVLASPAHAFQDPGLPPTGVSSISTDTLNFFQRELPHTNEAAA